MQISYSISPTNAVELARLSPKFANKLFWKSCKSSMKLR